MATERATNSPSERLTLRAAAAGMRRRASTSTAPMIFRQATVTSVTMATNTYSTKRTRTPLACARLGLMLASSIALYIGSPMQAQITVTTSSTFMSVWSTARMEPNSTLSMTWVLIFADTNSNSEAPRASEIDRKTPIRMSLDNVVRCCAYLSVRENSRQKANIET